MARKKPFLPAVLMQVTPMLSLMHWNGDPCIIAMAPYCSTGAPGWIIVSLLQTGFGVSPDHSIRPTSLAAAPGGQVPAGGVTRPSRSSQPAGTAPEGAIEP